MGKRTAVVKIDKNWLEEDEAPPTRPTLYVVKRKLPAKLCTVKQLMDRLATSADTIYRAIKSGELKYWAIGREYRFGEQDIEQYLDLRANKKKGLA